MKNYLQAIWMAFPRELTRQLASRLGEAESGVSKALRGVVPMVLCQTVIQAGEGKGQRMLILLQEAKPASLENRLTMTDVLGLWGGNGPDDGAWAIGQRLMACLFGARQHAELIDFVAANAGIRAASAAHLLGLVAAIQALELGRYVAQQQLNQGQFNAELVKSKDLAYDWLPDDLPRWPGYRSRSAVRAPHSVMVAELGRPHWLLMLSAAAVFVVMMMVLGALSATPVASGSATQARRPEHSARGPRLALANPDSLQLALPAVNRSTW